MFEFVALQTLRDANPAAPPLAAGKKTAVASWDALMEELMRAVAEKRGAVTRGLVVAAPWTIILDPTARTCLDITAKTPAGLDPGKAAALSAGQFLLCVWAEGFSNSFVLLCYRDGKLVRRLSVMDKVVELADGDPLPDEPENLSDLDHPALGAITRACHLDMDHVRTRGTFTLVTLTAPPRP